MTASASWLGATLPVCGSSRATEITQALEDLKARRTPLLVNISLVWLLVNVAVVLVLVAAEAPDPPSS
jgi:hypothetical protein